MATQLSSTTQKARKEHRCDSCCGTIDVGQEYHRSRMVDGGDAWVFKCHIACRKAGDILWDNDIRNEGEFIVNVSDMDWEDRAMIYREDAETFRAIWPEKPVPSTPTEITR